MSNGLVGLLETLHYHNSKGNERKPWQGSHTEHVSIKGAGATVNIKQSKEWSYSQVEKGKLF